jgi:hypothetical protein
MTKKINKLKTTDNFILARMSATSCCSELRRNNSEKIIKWMATENIGQIKMWAKIIMTKAAFSFGQAAVQQIDEDSSKPAYLPQIQKMKQTTNSIYLALQIHKLLK